MPMSILLDVLLHRDHWLTVLEDLLSALDALKDGLGALLRLRELSPKNLRHFLVSRDEGGLEWQWGRVEAGDEVEATNVGLDLLAINHVPALLDVVGPEHARHIDHH